MNPLPVVVEHVVFSVALEVFAELVCMPLDFGQQAVLLRMDVEVGKDSNGQQGRDDDPESQPDREFVFQLRLPPMQPVSSNHRVF